MGHIKEPKGVDFFISSEPLTEKDRKEISEFIRKYKLQKLIRTSKSTSKTNRTKVLQK